MTTRRRSPDSYAAICPTVVEIDELFSSQIVRDWRSIAIRQAAKEFASTLHSVLNVPRNSEPTAAGDQLLKLIPQLLTEAVKQQHRDIITEAIGRLAVGCQINLLPLLQAAVTDLRAISQMRPVQEDQSASNL